VVRKAWIQWALIAGVATGSGPACAGVHVALLPNVSQVLPGTEFDVRLSVMQDGDGFNGYTAVIAYDPGAVTFVPSGTHEGSYMVLACGSTSHSYTPGTGQVSISHSLFCQGVVLTGPGDLYVLRFRAANTAATATFHFASIQFYYAGVYVALSEAVDATVSIGSATDANSPRSTTSRPMLHVTPNPFSGSTSFHVALPGSRADATIYDARGRVVRSLPRLRSQAADFAAQWDGSNDSGASVPAGTYWIVVTSGSRSATTRVIRLD
jgi:hypothetical protein